MNRTICSVLKRMAFPCTLLFFLGGCKDTSLRGYPSEVENVLIQAKENRKELEKALNYFYERNDSVKRKAIEFLVSNMDIHYSSTYYWKASNGEKLDFSEFDYPDLKAAVAAIDSLRLMYGGLFYQDTTLYDMHVLTGDYLINHVNRTVNQWRHSPYKDIPFQDFCEYLLPYRITVEPLTDWWRTYNERYRWLGDSLNNKPLANVMDYAAIDYKDWFTFTTGKEPQRNEPLSRLSALQLLFRKKGPCEDVASLESFVLRSQSIPTAYITIPFWATSTGAHFINAVFTPDGKTRRLDVSRGSGQEYELDREPGRVIRHTYSKQPSTLAMREKPENIPPGFLRMKNYIDVTHDYWETVDVKAFLFKGTCPMDSTRIVYAGMFNHGTWKAGWWGEAHGDSVSFHNMTQGTVILPMTYENGTFTPVGYPVLNAYRHQIHLKPDYLSPRRVVIHEQDGYLRFRPKKKYELFYWDRDWISAGTVTTSIDTKELIYQNVPSNALLRLIPEYSEQKERPFIVLDNGIRYWW